MFLRIETGLRARFFLIILPEALAGSVCDSQYLGRMFCNEIIHSTRNDVIEPGEFRGNVAAEILARQQAVFPTGRAVA